MITWQIVGPRQSFWQRGNARDVDPVDVLVRQKSDILKTDVLSEDESD